MPGTIKIRAQLEGNVTTVKLLIKHPMETGQRKNPQTGELIPAHYIQEVNAEHSGNNVLKALWGIGVSANPYLSFKFSGASKGDKVTISWLDNKGEKDSETAEIA
jgi:sulfur-oxidizing protein SoxZ